MVSPGCVTLHGVTATHIHSSPVRGHNPRWSPSGQTRRRLTSPAAQVCSRGRVCPRALPLGRGGLAARVLPSVQGRHLGQKGRRLSHLDPPL